MSVGLFMTEKMPRTVQQRHLADKTKKEKINLLQNYQFAGSLCSSVEGMSTSRTFSIFNTFITWPQLLLPLQKLLQEESKEKAKWHEFPKFQGFIATTNTRQSIFSGNLRSCNKQAQEF